MYDFGAGDEFVATAGEGATLNGAELRAEGPGYGLELVGLEAAKPERVLPMIAELEGKAYRIRVVGSIAITVCWVAAGRLDGMLTGRACRSVDAAAAQLIAKEAGAAVEFSGHTGDADLSLDARYHVSAALDEEMLETLRPVQAKAEPVPVPE